MTDESGDQDLDGIEVETTELEGGGVELQIRFERAIQLSVDADRYTFKRLDDFANWIKGFVEIDEGELDGDPGLGNLDLEREPGTEPSSRESDLEEESNGR